MHLRYIGRAASFFVAVALAAPAIAHHVPVPLSYVAGEEILTQVTFRTAPNSVGVPAYLVSASEFEGPFALIDGSSFSLADELGSTDVVTFDASQFGDIAAATTEEIVAAINAQTSVATAFESNGFLVVEGFRGGPDAALIVSDGAGSPLGTLGLIPGEFAGTRTLDLVLSAPQHEGGPAAHHGNFAHHRYILLASTTEGETPVGDAGFSLPFAMDGTTWRVLAGTASGDLDEMKGRLDDGADAFVTVSARRLRPFLGDALPSRLFFAFVVVGGDGEVQFVSNRFTVDVVTG